MDLTAGDTSAGSEVLGWTPCRCKNNQVWDLHADDQNIRRMAPMALHSRHVSYDARDKTVTLMDAVVDNKGAQWRPEAVGGVERPGPALEDPTEQPVSTAHPFTARCLPSRDRSTGTPSRGGDLGGRSARD